MIELNTHIHLNILQTISCNIIYNIIHHLSSVFHLLNDSFLCILYAQIIHNNMHDYTVCNIVSCVLINNSIVCDSTNYTLSESLQPQ